MHPCACVALFPDWIMTWQSVGMRNFFAASWVYLDGGWWSTGFGVNEGFYRTHCFCMQITFSRLQWHWSFLNLLRSQNMSLWCNAWIRENSFVSSGYLHGLHHYHVDLCSLQLFPWLPCVLLQSWRLEASLVWWKQVYSMKKTLFLPNFYLTADRTSTLQ